MGVNQYLSKGRVYQYWRRKGIAQIRINPPLKGAALAAEIARLEKKYLEPQAIAGTLRLLIVQYKKKSNHWNGLRPRTVLDYERVFTWLGDAMDNALIEFDPPEIADLRDKARDQHEVKFANLVVTVLKKVFAYGLESGAVRANPAKDVSKLTGGNKHPNRPCTPKEAVALIDAAPAHLKPLIAIPLYTGLRLGDVAILSKSADKGEWLEVIQGKTRKPVLLPICEDLRWILDGIPKNDATTLCVKANGHPWAYEGVKTAWGRHRDALEAPGAIGPGVTFHGLRHTPATILAEAGYSDGEFAHLMGHGPKTISGHYARTAERRALLRDMALVIEEAYRQARGNVVRMEHRK